jgi:hypothetical protein
MNPTALQNTFGYVDQRTGTTASGSAIIHSGQQSALLGGLTRHIFGGKFRVPVLSTSGERFTLRVGLTNAVTGAGDPTNGIYVRSVDNISGSILHLVCRKANVEATLNGNTNHGANDWVNWRVEVDSSLNFVYFYMSLNNQALQYVGVISNASAIPLATTALGFAIKNTKSVGLTQRNIYHDLVFYDMKV